MGGGGGDGMQAVIVCLRESCASVLGVGSFGSYSKASNQSGVVADGCKGGCYSSC